jgi:hypothetical protein
LGGISAPSADIHKAKRFLRASNTGFLEGLDGRHREIDVDLRIFLFGETLDRLSERPNATVVVGELGDNILRVLRKILYDYRLGFLAGVWGEVGPRGDLAAKEEGDVGYGRVSQGSMICSKSS